MQIRRAIEKDLENIHKLVRELALYEKAPDEVNTSPQDYIRDFKAGWFDAFVAEYQGAIIGMAVFHKAYSTWKGPMLYLEDLIVTESFRRYGVGTKLMERLVRHAQEVNAVSIKWQVLDWNTPAIEFYKKYNVHLDPEWINCRLFL